MKFSKLFKQVTYFQLLLTPFFICSHADCCSVLVIDLLRELGVPSASGVNTVPGSQSDRTAYQLGPHVHITRKTRYVR